MKQSLMFLFSCFVLPITRFLVKLMDHVKCEKLIKSTKQNKNLTLDFLRSLILEVYSLILHLERSDYSLEQIGYLVERSVPRMEQNGLE